MEYEIVIGLEVHTQLKTNSKLFCNCKTKFGATSNTQVCPVCLGLPGVLPVINKQAFEHAIKSALALNCQITPFTKFDRKNYYYPDLPKNYQISQYDLPFSHDGHLEIEMNGQKKGIGITRVHLEEDAGKLVHPVRKSGATGENDSHSFYDNITKLSNGVHPEHTKDYSLVDLNRTGIPLLEVVSKPEINSPEEAYAYLTELKALLQYLDVSDCDMEKGSLRCDANLSVREKGSKALGVKTEIKNLNSFKFVAKALDYEAKRQIELLKQGEPIIPETRLWDEPEEITRLMRSKEEIQDYRYFPEPDLVPLVIDDKWIEQIKQTIPELPKIRKQRFVSQYQLPEYDAGVLTQDKTLADYFEKCVELYLPVVSDGNAAKSISNKIMNTVLRELNEKKISIDEFPVTPDKLVKLVKMFDNKEVTSAVSAVVLTEMIKTGQDAETIIKNRDLKQVSDEGVIEGIIKQVLKDHPKIVADYKGGKKTAISALIGQVMKASKGKANPQIVKTLLSRML